MLRNDDGTTACICHEHRTECNCQSPKPEKKVRRTPRYGWAIPNRLYGVEINSQGDAI